MCIHIILTRIKDNSMWSKTYSQKVTGIRVEDLWQVWADINHWHLWHDDIEYAKLDGAFTTGSKFLLKPKHGPKVTIELLKVEPNQLFIDLTRFPLAKMYGIHEFIADGDQLEIRTTMRVTGPLSFIWRKLVAEKIIADEPKQTHGLITQATKLAQGITETKTSANN